MRNQIQCVRVLEQRHSTAEVMPPGKLGPAPTPEVASRTDTYAIEPVPGPVTVLAAAPVLTTVLNTPPGGDM